MVILKIKWRENHMDSNTYLSIIIKRKSIILLELFFNKLP